jgi:hypothetical protein
VRAAVHALDAALAEHRRGLALAASRREQARMALSREVKAAAAASAEALEQPVERPMRAVRVAETWIEVDRAKHPLTGAVRAAVSWVSCGFVALTGRLGSWSLRARRRPRQRKRRRWRSRSRQPPPARARERLALVAAAGANHAAACHAAAVGLDAADRELLERHADHARVESSAAELESRLGPRRLGEDSDIAAARDRLRHARARLAASPAQPYAWARDIAPAVAGAAMRDLPEDALVAARPALGRLTVEAGELLALAGDGAGQTVVAITEQHAIVANAAGAVRHAVGEAAVEGDRLLVEGHRVAGVAVESRPGRLAAVLELVQRS